MSRLSFILHDLRSAYNVGAILRTADGIGVHTVYLTGYTCTPHDGARAWTTRPERMIGKTALGADQAVRWEKYDDIVPLLTRLRAEGAQIVAVEQTPTSIPVAAFVPTSDHVVLILGNEPRGIDPALLALTDCAIEIPMRGTKNSLNVAVAAGVAGYGVYDSLKRERL